MGLLTLDAKALHFLILYIVPEKRGNAGVWDRKMIPAPPLPLTSMVVLLGMSCSLQQPA